MSVEVNNEEIKGAVRERYAGIADRIARSGANAGCCGPNARSTCCGPSPETTAAAQLYPVEELTGLPPDLGEASLGCGNPLALAELQPGEVVLDLGSGAGLDCFLAARKVGPTGRVIGLDMTPEMIALARRNATRLGATNVEFRLGEMEQMPLTDESVDAILSNCVVNLSPDKGLVFREAFRVLRPGGRLSISDIVVDGELPPPIRASLSAWAGCIAGALDEADYLHKIEAAGFDGVAVLSRDYVPLNEGEDWAHAAELLEQAGLSPHALDCKVASIRVRAVKPDFPDRS